MFKVVFVFGVIVASAAGESTPHSILSRHAELTKSSNQTDQSIEESFGKPTIDNLKPQRPNSQDPKTGQEPLIWLLKWSLTNYSCPPEKQIKVPCKNLSGSVLVRKEDRTQNNMEKIPEVETSHPKEKRKATIPRSELNLLNDWMENKVKVSHIRNIYIGRSMYPFMYEESRVIEGEPDASQDENSSQKEVKISETRPKKKEEVPVYEITRIYEIR